MSSARSSASSDASPEPSTVAAATSRAVVPPDGEWLLTDGGGGYACGTAAGLPMRRYHGLWVARPDGIAGRRMIVAGLDERIGPAVKLGDSNEAQSAHVMAAHWADLPAPSAGQGRTSFVLRPLPTWTFATEFGVVERTVALRRRSAESLAAESLAAEGLAAEGLASAGSASEGFVGEGPAGDGVVRDGAPALLVRWRNRSPHPVRVQVRPLLGWCNVDHLLPADESFDDTVHACGASWGFRPNDDLPTLWLTVDGVAAFRSEASWYRGFRYEMDRVRGYDHVGDRWSPGVVELDLPPGGEATASFALGEPCAAAAKTFDGIAAQALQKWQHAVGQQNVLLARLELGADDFLYRGVGNRLGVLAGFPWFGEWGRDVFLALPGLTLARGRADLCAEVMTGCLPFLRDGLLPNIYGKDIATSHYGSCDAALWFALAAIRFADAGHDPQLVQDRLLPALRSIADAYQRGTDLGLKVAASGLLQAGNKDLNATWMDARTSKGPVTPREGLPVEIQAVWYALLAFLAEWEGVEGEGRSKRAGKRAGKSSTKTSAGRFATMRDACGKAFVKAFWLATEKSLADRVHDGVADRSVRPNMLVAAALSRSPLTRVQREGVVKMAKQHLVAPCGLRTLAPSDEHYRGIYGGGLEGRDNAYHQGTVWPWPAGFLVEAALRSVTKKSRQQEATALLAWLDALLATELDRAGLDHVSEVFDGDAPHRPGGTFAQAWNTGELLRAYALCKQVVQGSVVGSSVAGSSVAGSNVTEIP